MNIMSVVLGIVLSTLALLVSVSFFGSIFGNGSASATASTLINQSKEVVDGLRLYRAVNDGQVPVAESGGQTVIDLRVLVDEGYLKEVPQPWRETGHLTGTPVAIPEMGQDSCIMINRSVNYHDDDVPSCSAVPAALLNSPFYCCSD